MDVPIDCKYSETHEWYRVSGNIVTLGITQFAANELTDITYVELPSPGTEIGAGEVLGEVESVKATSELLCAVSGTVAEINEALADHPELLNRDAFGAGWIARIQVKDLSPLGSLLDADAYQSVIA